MASDMALIVCGVAGMGALVLAWPQLLQGLRFGGAAFLACYGLLAAHRAWRGTGALQPGQGQPQSRRRVLLACLAFTFLNPHVYLDTMVLIGTISTRYAGTAQWAFGLGACLASVVWFSALGFGGALFATRVSQSPCVAGAGCVHCCFYAGAVWVAVAASAALSGRKKTAPGVPGAVFL